MKKSIVLGSGSYLPENVLTNEDMAEYVETSHEWIVSRTGIHSRHFAGEGEFTSDLAHHAARDCLTRANISPEEVDLVIVATATPDETFPSTATRVQGKLGMPRGVAFDISAACSGFIAALATADNFLRLGQAKRALVIGAETFSRIVDMTDRSTCVLFGDGAGALLLEAREDEENIENRGLISTTLHSDGQFHDILYTNGGPSSTGAAGVVCMRGPEMYRHAVTKLFDVTDAALKAHNLTVDDIDWLVPHQANIRIIDSLAERLGFPQEKIITALATHANTSAASIPLALDQAVKKGDVQPGHLILKNAIGAGLFWGSALIRW